MAARRPRRTAAPPPPPGGGEESLSIIAGLGEFSALLDEFAAAISQELELAGQTERQVIAQAFRDTLAVQSASIRDMFRDVVGGLPAEGRTDAELFWRASGAAVAIGAARAAIQNPALAKRTVLEWIKLILELIKKVIAEILEHLGHLFPWLLNPLSIILEILKILNNLLAGLNELLAGREPVDMNRLSNEMWQGLEVFWRAKAAFLKVGSAKREDADTRGAAT